MLTRSRLAASVGAASAWLALSTATAAAAPPLPTDGSGSCASQFCTVVAEQPKLNPHIPAMKDKLAEVMAVSPEDISIKATTNEKMGFLGRQEGMAAYVTVLLQKY